MDIVLAATKDSTWMDKNCVLALSSVTCASLVARTICLQLRLERERLGAPAGSRSAAKPWTPATLGALRVRCFVPAIVRSNARGMTRN